MKHFKLLTILFFLASAAAFAQDGLSSINTYLDKLRRDDYFTAPNQLKYNDINGSPYLSDDFRQGVLLMKSGQPLSGEFRFDIYANQVEYRKDENTFVIAKPDSISKIEIDELVIVYRDFSEKDEVKKGYFIQLEEGYYSVYQQKTIHFRSASQPKPYQDAPLPARFEEGTDQFYMSVGDSPAVKVANANDIARLCGDRGQVARDFIKKERINLKRSDDLISLIRYLNESRIE